MPNILKVITDPNPILRQKSTILTESDIKQPGMKKFLEDMVETMLEKDGIGLAAPQVGRNIRLIVVNTKDGVLPMFNPQIIKRSFRKCREQEGCLSVPDIFGEVKRHRKITCTYNDLNFNQIKLEAEGLLARIIQHENDHLDGILFIDKAKGLHKIDNKKM